jgi:mannose-6-phosphate isomerase-like protein (cupin superfamily)
MLTDGGRTRQLASSSRSLGFVERGQPPRPGAVLVQIPDELRGAEVSVCGVKGFLVDERRVFRDETGAEVEVACAKVAALDIDDSPVHVHGETLETYQILAGSGRMVLDQRVVPVRAGSLVVIPPGVEHGLASDVPGQPLRVLMTFTPGLAPVAEQRFRDERILHPRASARIAALGG